MFWDVSSLAYGAVAYVSVIVHNDIICRLIIAKSRLVPLKGHSLTIPKFELQAAVLAVRLKEAIVTEPNAKPNSIYFWLDSRTVFKYICNENSHFPPYIMHRVNEIRHYSNIEIGVTSKQLITLRITAYDHGTWDTIAAKSGF